ncbi:hypothetical protein DFH09DRAFT_1192504 [Mycena vulgaris]|nr:hypothetical protein DFH09DRAFT_1192504 [Mycena vulgaris]
MADVVITVIHYKPPPPRWYFSRAYRAPILLQSSPRLRGLQWFMRFTIPILISVRCITFVLNSQNTQIRRERHHIRCYLRHADGTRWKRQRRAGDEWEREDSSNGLGKSILRPTRSGRRLAWVLDKRTVAWLSCALKYLEERRGECQGGSRGIAAVPRNLQEVTEGGRETY